MKNKIKYNNAEELWQQHNTTNAKIKKTQKLKTQNGNFQNSPSGKLPKIFLVAVVLAGEFVLSFVVGSWIISSATWCKGMEFSKTKFWNVWFNSVSPDTEENESSTIREASEGYSNVDVRVSLNCTRNCKERIKY